MSDERPTGAPADQLAVQMALDGRELDRKLAALAAMASQTRDLTAMLGADLYARQVREEAFVDAIRAERDERCAPVSRRSIIATGSD